MILFLESVRLGVSQGKCLGVPTVTSSSYHSLKRLQEEPSLEKSSSVLCPSAQPATKLRGMFRNGKKLTSNHTTLQNTLSNAVFSPTYVGPAL